MCAECAKDAAVVANANRPNLAPTAADLAGGPKNYGGVRIEDRGTLIRRIEDLAECVGEAIGAQCQGGLIEGYLVVDLDRDAIAKALVIQGWRRGD